MKPLFSEYSLGKVRLKNRVVMAPMTRCRATTDHVPTALMAEYYAQRAEAGLLITEGTAPTGNGCGYARIPGLWNEEQTDAWKVVTDRVHASGGAIAAQIMHTGRVSHPDNMPPGSRVLAPSANQAPGEMYTDQNGPQPYPVAQAMNESDIEAEMAGIVAAAKNAVAAGFDFVELHGANGYLLDQFLAPKTNQRDDAYGGDFAGRSRFLLATVEKTIAAIGKEKVGLRVSPFGVFNGIEPWDSIESDYTALAEQLGQLGCSFLHLVDHSGMGAPPVPDSIKRALRDAFPGTLILSGNYDADRAAQDLADQRGDLVAFGRPYLANPDLARRLREKKPLNEPDPATFYTPGEKGYTDYPALSND